MKTQRTALLLTLLAPRVARTRTDQVFTNRADGVVEGIYEFTLPEGAIITDLVLWIGDKRVQGIIMEKEAARRVYDAIVRRRIDPALIEQVTPNQFRLSIFPFPAQGSRRVEFEYMQLLEARSGRLDYTFPLAPETDQAVEMKLFVLRAQVRSQHPFEASVSGLPRLTEVTRPDDHSAEIFFGDEEVSPREDFTLTLHQHDDQLKPTVLSFAPQGAEDLGYYALWLPPVPELTQGDPLPRSLTFVIDISSSMQRGKLQAVRAPRRGPRGAGASGSVQPPDSTMKTQLTTLLLTLLAPLPALDYVYTGGGGRQLRIGVECWRRRSRGRQEDVSGGRRNYATSDVDHGRLAARTQVSRRILP